jgi:hypothetical protein
LAILVVVGVLLVVLIVGVLLNVLVADVVRVGDEPPVLVAPEQPVNRANKVPIDSAIHLRLLDISTAISFPDQRPRWALECRRSPNSPGVAITTFPRV